MIIDVLIFPDNEQSNRLPHQMAPLFSQQGSSGEIGLQDYSLFIEGDISHRGKVVKIKILFAGCFEFLLRMAKLVILHLKFDLVHPQLVEYAPHINGRYTVQCPRPLQQNFFSHSAQVRSFI